MISDLESVLKTLIQHGTVVTGCSIRTLISMYDQTPNKVAVRANNYSYGSAIIPEPEKFEDWILDVKIA